MPLSAPHPVPAAPSPRNRWIDGMPAIFVLLWSTGFIGAKLGSPWAPPLSFLTYRFALVTAVLAIAAVAVRAPWPRSVTQLRHLAVGGVLIHAVYLGGVFYAISVGVTAGQTALVVGLQPLATAAVSGPYLGERVRGRQWVGLVLGFAGVTLVVADKLGWQGENVRGVLAALAALAGITVGTLYQKRHATGMNLLTGSCVQFAAAGLVTAPAALLLESRPVEWTPAFVFALLWLAFVLSIGAITLLHLMIRRGAASRVASLFYLTPAVTALLARLLFGETLSWPAIVGMVVAAAGVALASRR